MSKRILFASIKKSWVLQKLSKFPNVLELIDGRAATWIQTRNLNLYTVAIIRDPFLHQHQKIYI